MLVTGKYGNINASGASYKNIDKLPVEWYEITKRILHKTTVSGTSLTLKFLNENPNLKDGDILWQDENSIIIVDIIPSECMVITPDTIITAAALCYEIGNRHLPLFYEENELLIPYDVPLYNLLRASDYMIRLEKRKLNCPFKTTVLPHVQVTRNDSIPGKILQLSTSS